MVCVCVCVMCAFLCVCMSVHSCPGPVELAGSAVLLGLVRHERELHLSLSVPSPQPSSLVGAAVAGPLHQPHTGPSLLPSPVLSILSHLSWVH